MLIKFMTGNIADMCADAVVLPSNSYLKEGAGASQALFEKAGRKKLQTACEEFIDEVGVLRVGDVAITPAFNLNASYIIHAVVPKWVDGNSDEYVNLMMSYSNALGLADHQGCTSIAFPLLASGNNGFDLDLAFNIAKEAISSYDAQNKLEEAYVVLYGDRIVTKAVNAGCKVFPIRKEKNKKLLSHSNSKTIDDSLVIDLMKTGWKWIKEFDQDHPEFRKKAEQVVADALKKKLGMQD